MTTAIDTTQNDTEDAADAARSASIAQSPTSSAATDAGEVAPSPAPGSADAEPSIPPASAAAPADTDADSPAADAQPAASDGALPDEHVGAAPPCSSPASPKPPAAPPADCGPWLKKTFPALFAGAPKPLKLRIQTDIQERAPGVFGKQALSAFFRRYTGSTSYLIAVSKAKTRFDLDGAPAGELSEEHRQIALDELARRRSNHESRAALEEQQRRNRATLLHDFERTTLTPANFCALKGIGVDELEGYLATARREAAERPQNPRAFEGRPSRSSHGDQPPRRPPHRQGPARPAPGTAEAGRPGPRRR